MANTGAEDNEESPNARGYNSPSTRKMVLNLLEGIQEREETP